ncbi:MAG: hypothetical protein AB8B63_02670 [Granulosicoccus sp.]
MSKKSVEQETIRNIAWSMDLISTLEHTVRNSELLLARIRQSHDAQQLVCSSRYVSSMSKGRLQQSHHAGHKPAQSDVEL